MNDMTLITGMVLGTGFVIVIGWLIFLFYQAYQTKDIPSHGWRRAVDYHDDKYSLSFAIGRPKQHRGLVWTELERDKYKERRRNMLIRLSSDG